MDKFSNYPSIHTVISKYKNRIKSQVIDNSEQILRIKLQVQYF